MNILVLLPSTDADRQRFSLAAPEATIIYKSPSEISPSDVEWANIAIGNIPKNLLPFTKNLLWQQLNTAGSDGYTDGSLPHDCFLTNATGAYGLAISEHMIATILMIYKHLHLYRDNQTRSLWQDEGMVRSIEGSTVLVVGLGDIGGDFAKKIKSLGATVWGIRRVPRDKPDYLEDIFSLDQLDDLLPMADIVACSLPGTPSTKGLFDNRRLSLMKKNSVFINVGRGNVVDTNALVDALHSGNILGAGLDVTDPEPLPPDHPLWHETNCIITPHVSGGFHLPQTLERIIDISIRNIKNFVSNRPLENIVDFNTGYRKL